ncbi:UDP-N-acetylmuramate dehydrogenase [Colwellia hornerae]|uniref:UDP-N-acetylenolpyruvoylglucosamine reductase n=1 Tax=Colwellia hornerae TaxID=89402 RepID=A0ABY3H9J0_9GAMM|nr:UDP-N-acetylmuramate dehydrogenase [Colwellia hornerae]TWX51094.1 UDP-N-acetylmuramate dehydrogenase [Colwellia hornerae]TWX56770.1 UDP-N-acetylmuramate dehydrogenase [Colwellia hornerae]
MKSLQQFSLQKNNSFAVDTVTPVIYYPKNDQDLQLLATVTSGCFYILGEGSNTLFVEDFTPVIIKPEFLGIHVKETNDYYQVNAACGENWHDLVCFCINKGINGLENLALIPGSVGAAPVQNIGAYGVEIADFIESVTWFDFAENKSQHLFKAQCQFGYRNSIFKQQLKNKGIITDITLRFPKNWQPKLNYQGLKDLPENTSAKAIMNAVIAIRNSKLPDPKVIPNAGSFFKNPLVSAAQFLSLKNNHPTIPYYRQSNGSVKLAAGWLIEKSALKGYQMSGAAVHDKQALVLTNLDSASGLDIKNLAIYVQKTVFDLFAICLQPEVRMIAEQGEVTLGAIN